MKAILKRILQRPDGMFGIFILNDFPLCVTLELPWKDNHPQESCIPAGEYICKRVNSPHHGDTFEVTNVPNRTHILFHGANTIVDLLGCIGLAEFFHQFDGKAGVANPYRGAAMIEFHQATLGVNEFELEILEYLGESNARRI